MNEHSNEKALIKIYSHILILTTNFTKFVVLFNKYGNVLQ
jgi:hypothetical protein